MKFCHALIRHNLFYGRAAFLLFLKRTAALRRDVPRQTKHVFLLISRTGIKTRHRPGTGAGGIVHLREFHVTVHCVGTEQVRAMQTSMNVI